jgi:regulator of protease activity HflC (stomatin/prohibitin superfamily)
MFDKLIDIILQFIGLFKFWRVIPVNKKAVRIRWGKNPTELGPGIFGSGFHFVWPFEIDHVDTVVYKPEWASSFAIHITTTDNKTIAVGPVLKFTILDAVKWFYEIKSVEEYLHDVVRLCTSDVLTDCTWEECMKKPIWTKIKNKIKERTKEIGIEIEDFGLVDLAIVRIYITSLN